MKTFKMNALRSNGGVREPEFARINRIGRIDGCPDFNEEEYTGFSRDARTRCMYDRPQSQNAAVRTGQRKPAL